MGKYCTNCGMHMYQDAVFCINCGTKSDDSVIVSAEDNSVVSSDIADNEVVPAKEAPVVQAENNAVLPIEISSATTTPADPSKKNLTSAVIDKDLHNQKHSVWEYFGQVILLGLIILLISLGAVACVIFILFLFLNVLRMVRSDIKRSRLRYDVIERECLEKKIEEYDESPDEYKLWFLNQKGDLYVAATVEKDFYDASEVGEEFYVVFLLDDRLPCLCYRKSEWIR